MWQSPRTGVETRELVGADKEVEHGAADPRLKPDVSGGVLLLRLSLFNMDLISCFPACL